MANQECLDFRWFCSNIFIVWVNKLHTRLHYKVNSSGCSPWLVMCRICPEAHSGHGGGLFRLSTRLGEANCYHYWSSRWQCCAEHLGEQWGCQLKLTMLHDQWNQQTTGRKAVMAPGLPLATSVMGHYRMRHQNLRRCIRTSGIYTGRTFTEKWEITVDCKQLYYAAMIMW